jgi:hypothetical protein
MVPPLSARLPSHENTPLLGSVRLGGGPSAKVLSEVSARVLVVRLLSSLDEGQGRGLIVMLHTHEQGAIQAMEGIRRLVTCS